MKEFVGTRFLSEWSMCSLETLDVAQKNESLKLVTDSIVRLGV